MTEVRYNKWFIFAGKTPTPNLDPLNLGVGVLPTASSTSRLHHLRVIIIDTRDHLEEKSRVSNSTYPAKAILRDIPDGVHFTLV
jgi:hypothetical protein